MSVIKIENLTFSYSSACDNIFDNVSFQLDTDWKLGFTGRNGRGKTTFLKLLQGKYEYGGKILSPVKFDYFPYDAADKTELTQDVLQAVCPTAEDWQIIRELSYLDVECNVLYRPFNTLSNGEQTKVLLAALFLNEESFLLIDEPTNHLDAHAREVLSKYLKKKKGFILVSHDRAFLDGCVDHIMSINKNNIEIQKGNFSSYMANYRLQQDFERKQNERLQRSIDRLQESAQQSACWSFRTEAEKSGAADKGFVGRQAAQMMKRAKSIQSRRQKAIDEKSALLKNAENESSLKISPKTYREERLASFKSVVPCYGGSGVCSPVSFEIKRGDRIVLDGKNGSGKSSLLKLLCGHNIDCIGTVEVGSNFEISYIPQDTSHLQGTFKDFACNQRIDESLFKTILYKMGFERRLFEKKLNDLSDGQKKKVLIAKSLCEQAHLYVWDEPLNFIDVYSRIQIEELLMQFKPTMIFVEHDKAFQDNIATKVVKL